MRNTELTCTAVMALKGDPSDVKALIKTTIISEEEMCFKAMKPFIFANGIHGNAHYDHKSAVDLFLKRDAEIGGAVGEWFRESGLKMPALWNMIARVLRGMGWDIHNGYIVGISEKLTHKQNDQ